jgi:predicted GNAT superfamily acetyltransferase
MAAHRHACEHSGMATADAARIEPLRKEEMLAAEALFRRVYGFTELESVPAWVLHSAGLQGGIVLGARSGDELAGAAYAVPSGAPATLWWLLLAVAPAHRSRGLGERLLRALRRHALESGYRTLRACTDVLASHLLALYVARTPGRVVAYHADLYRGLTSGAVHGGPGDEVGLEWDLGDAAWDRPPRITPAGPPKLLTETALDSRGLRRFRSARRAPATDARTAIEVPWDGAALRGEHPEEARRWQDGIRPCVDGLLGRGYVGRDVISNRGARRAYLVFTR